MTEEQKLAALLKELGALEFKPFTESDWSGFAGCNSKTPMIAYAEERVVILDGNTIVTVDPEGTETFMEWRTR